MSLSNLTKRDKETTNTWLKNSDLRNNPSSSRSFDTYRWRTSALVLEPSGSKKSVRINCEKQVPLVQDCENQKSQAETVNKAFSNKPRVIHSLNEGTISIKSASPHSKHASKAQASFEDFSGEGDKKPPASPGPLLPLSQSTNKLDLGSKRENCTKNDRNGLLCNFKIEITHGVSTTVSIYQNSSIFDIVDDIDKEFCVNMDPKIKGKLAVIMMKQAAQCKYGILPADLS